MQVGLFAELCAYPKKAPVVLSCLVRARQTAQSPQRKRAQPPPTGICGAPSNSFISQNPKMQGHCSPPGPDSQKKCVEPSRSRPWLSGGPTGTGGKRPYPRSRSELLADDSHPGVITLPSLIAL